MARTFSIEVDDGLAEWVGPSAALGERSAFLQEYGSHPAAWQVKGLFVLACSDPPAMAETALHRFRELPHNVVDDAYAQGLEAQVIDLLVREHHGNSAFLGKVVLRDQLSRPAFYHLVLSGSDTAIDTLRRRNMNLLNSPVVLERLFENQKVRKSTIDRILQILGMEVEVSVDEEEARAAASPTPSVAEAAVPVLEGLRLQGFEDGAASLSSAFDPEIFRSFLEGQEFDFARERTDEAGADRKLDEAEREGLFRQLMKMTVPQKVLLAMRGNREARNLLLRDSNRLIPLYVLQNKGITDEEIANIAASPTSNRELIQEISKSREFTRGYKVRRALAVNAKTPLSVAMRFLGTLNKKDVRDISRSKNVPSALAIQAKRLLDRSKPGGEAPH